MAQTEFKELSAIQKAEVKAETSAAYKLAKLRDNNQIYNITT